VQVGKDVPPKGGNCLVFFASRSEMIESCSLKGRIWAARQGNDFDLFLATPYSGSAWDRIARLRRTAKLAGGRRKI